MDTESTTETPISSAKIDFITDEKPSAMGRPPKRNRLLDKLKPSKIISSNLNEDPELGPPPEVEPEGISFSDSITEEEQAAKIPFVIASEAFRKKLQEGEQIPELQGLSRRDKKKFSSLPDNFPVPPNTILPVTKFEAYTKAIPKEYWETIVMWYVYRMWPLIDRKLTDPKNPNYIDKRTTPFSKQWLLNEFGAGDYRIILVRTGLPSNAGANILCETRFSMLDAANFPPKLDYRELIIGNRANQSFVDGLVRRGILTPEGRVKEDPEEMQQTANNTVIDRAFSLLEKHAFKDQSKSPESGTLEKVVGIMDKANDKAIEIVAQASNPKGQLEMMKLMSDVMKPQDNGTSTAIQVMTPMMQLVTAMMQQQQQSQQLFLEMFKASMEKKSEPQQNSNLKETVELIGSIKEIFGGGDEGGGGRKKSTLETVMEYGAPVLSQALGFFQNVMAMNAMKKNPAMANQMFTPSGPPPQPGQEGQQQPQLSPPDAQAQQVAMLQQYMPFIANKIISGQSGYEFAEMLIQLLGQDQAMSLIIQMESMGPEATMTLFQSVPAVWEQLQKVKPAFEKFVQEFCGYREWIKQQESEDEDV